MRKRVKIYKSRLHLWVTLLVIVVPFAFLLAFSRLANIETNQLFVNIFISVVRLVVAYFGAAILAWVSAVLFYKGRASLIALPVFDVLQSFPTFAALPLVINFWGPSNFTVIFFLIVTIIWPVFFSIINSLKLTKHEWEEAVEVTGLRGFSYLRYFLWPISIPGLITGSIIGIGEAWEALVATEIIVGVKNGLGSFFKFFSGNPTITTLGILGLLILIFSINKLIWIPLLDKGHQLMEE